MNARVLWIGFVLALVAIIALLAVERGGETALPSEEAECLASYEVVGTVRDSSDSLVAQALVYVVDGPWTTSQADGSFRLDLGRGRWELHATTSRGEFSPPVLVDVPSQLPVTLPVTQFVPLDDGSIAGTVVDWEGRPVAAARILVESPEFDGPAEVVREARSGEGGRFRVEGLRGGTLWITASTSHDASDRLELALNTREIPQVRIELLQSGRIEGTIDRGLGEIAGRTVALWYGQEVVRRVVSDAEGRFALEDLFPRRYMITLHQEPALRPLGGRLVPTVSMASRPCRYLHVASARTTRVAFDLAER